jgi:hypothetical protein
VSHSNPPSLWGKLIKRHFFPISYFFHFGLQDKQNNFFFCKRLDKKMHKKLLFLLSQTKITFSLKKVILTRKTGKKVKKRGKKAFFLNS